MKHTVLAGVALAALVSPVSAWAQDQSTAGARANSPDGDAEITEIIVTANRREERLVDVAATVTAVTSEQVLNLKLFRTEDVAALSPGLTLSKGLGGFFASASLRGVESVAGGGAPTVDFYFNDVAQDANYTINSMYDVGQIEILRGPQGTLRGRPSPSGAITITSRRPDLTEFGGYAQFTGTSRNGINAQFGVSVPIIKDKLAIRLSGLKDDTDGTLIRSVNNGTKPFSRTWSGRVTVLAKPVDALEIVGTYQHLEVDSRQFTQVAGFFPGLAAVPARGFPAVPAGYNGPLLVSADRKAVGELPMELSQNGEFASLQAKLSLPFDADLIYVGAYQNQNTLQVGPSDPGNYVTNADTATGAGGPQRYWTHELRLQSTGNQAFDYVIGGYYSKTDSLTNFATNSPRNGAFGTGSPTFQLLNRTSGPVNPIYELIVNGSFRVKGETSAIFGNLTWHATDRFDITGGVRYNHVTSTTTSVQTLGAARQLVAYIPAVPAFGLFFPNTCALVPGGAASQYPGYCSVPIPAGTTAAAPVLFKESPWTFSASAKYEITEDINAYASFGRSFRAGGNNLAALATTDPLLAGVRGQQPSETSNSYELGVKGTLLDNRLRFSAAVFQQDFKNLIVQISGVPVLVNGVVTPRDIVYGADARVRGFEAELGARIGDNFDFSLNANYADGKFRDALIPCQTFTAAGIPIQPTAAAPIAFCRSNGSSSSQPRFSANLQAEYRVPFGNNVGYLRTLTTYRNKATNEAVKFTAQDFATVNLFAGVRIGDVADISLYAKNVFNADVELFRAASPFADFGGLIATAQNPLGSFSPTVGSGYFETRRNALREFGLSVRVQWGSK